MKKYKTFREILETRHEYDAHYDPTFEVVATEYYCDGDGKVLSRGVKKTVDNSYELAQYKLADFYLENIIASGAVNTLKYSTQSGDSVNVADYIGSQIDNLPQNVEE